METRSAIYSWLWSLISSCISLGAATLLLSNQEPACHPAYVGKMSPSKLAEEGRKEDETRLLSVFFVPILTKFSALWKMHKVDVEWAAVDVCETVSPHQFSILLLAERYIFVYIACIFSPWDIYKSNMVALFIVNAAVALVKWVRSGLMLTFRTAFVFPWALVTAGYFHLSQPFSGPFQLSSLIAFRDNMSLALHGTYRWCTCFTATSNTQLTLWDLTFYFDLIYQWGTYTLSFIPPTFSGFKYILVLKKLKIPVYSTILIGCRASHNRKIV